MRSGKGGERQRVGRVAPTAAPSAAAIAARAAPEDIRPNADGIAEFPGEGSSVVVIRDAAKLAEAVKAQAPVGDALILARRGRCHDLPTNPKLALSSPEAGAPHARRRRRG